MTTFLAAGGTAALKRRNPTPAAALRIQTSVNGAPRAFGYGQARIAGNILNEFGFTSDAQNTGGKGGAGAQITGYNYYVSVVFGLCEGPIDSIVQAWENASPDDINAPSGSTAVWSVFAGSYVQEPWPAMEGAAAGGQAQNYRGIAYAAVSNKYLGETPEIGNWTFEVKFGIGDCVAEIVTVPASPYQVAAQYFNWDNGVATHFTVPFASPYEFSPDANGNTIGAALNAIAETIQPYDYLWGLSNSSGIVWDEGATNGTPGQPLTRVGTTPSASGEYQVFAALGAGITWKFAPQDVGQPVVGLVCAVSPGVYYAGQFSATASAGSATLTNFSSTAGIAVGSRVIGGGASGIAPGAFVTEISGGAATGTTTSGSTTIGSVAGSYVASSGTPIKDIAGAIPIGTTVFSSTGAAIVMNNTASGTASQETVYVAVTMGGTLVDNEISVSSSSGIVAGAHVSDTGGFLHGQTVAGITGTTVTLSAGTGITTPTGDSFTFTSEIKADLTTGQNTLANVSDLRPLVASAALSDAYGFLPSGTTIASSTGGSLVLSQAATASVTGDELAFGTAVTLSQTATVSGGVTLLFRGASLSQVLSSPSQGQFVLSIQAGSFGTYTFSAADQGKTMQIIDLPDANPADVLYDFLSNPYYGVTQFDTSRIGALSTYRDYCVAAGLFVSPTISTQAQANQFVQDLMKATNSEIVWSAGYLTVVPYGDAAISGNGASYMPPSAPLYSLDDDDFLEANQATNPRSTSAASSPDPVQVTRTDKADQENDIKLEYLDRASSYNPSIVEAQDDAAVTVWGLKNSGSKQMHLFCNATSALNSAQLMLGRQSILRSFAFTLDRKYILLDPMDIIAITDENAGLADQWVRIKEITENDDRSLSIVAEEYLTGTGSAPAYGAQRAQPPDSNLNVPAPSAGTPIFFDAPVQIGNVLAMETLIFACGGGAPDWGGCQVWISTDDVNFKYAGTITGPAVMGTLTASFGTLAVSTTLAAAMTASQISLGLSSGSSFPASGSFVVQIDSELIQVGSLSGTTGSALVRGFDGTTSMAHTNGATVTLLSDEVNTLAVDLTESEGQLTGGAQADADNGNTLCLVDSELVTYETATLTSEYGYSLGTYLRRGFYGTTIASHSSGAPFARVKDGSYLALGYNASQIGTTIYAKLLSFNQFGGGQETLDEVSSVSHVIGAAPVSPGPLLDGDIQGGDIASETVQTGNIAPNAATNQATNNTAGPISCGAGGTLVASQSLTTIGGAVQLAFNFLVGNASGSAVAFGYELFNATTLRVVYSTSASIYTVANNGAFQIAGQAVDTPTAGSNTYQLSVIQLTSSGVSAYNIDLSATEIRR